MEPQLSDPKGDFKDKVHTHVWVKFDWTDRIRILFGKKAHIDVVVETNDPIVHVTKSSSTVWVEKIINFKKHKGGMILASEMEKLK